MESGIVQCVVTSPPYWGLRDYGIEGQLGLEETPEEYIDKMVEIFREVKRVMRDDGTLWLNMGDCYASAHAGINPIENSKYAKGMKAQKRYDRPHPKNLKFKDLVGMPWALAFALQADGWYLRSDIIWSKPNPMPESCTDRPTKAHEYVFLMSKQAKYFYDSDAVREVHQDKHGIERFKGKCNINKNEYESSHQGWYGVGYKKTHNEYNPQGRNRRTVWNIPTQPYSEAHFATFPVALVIPCVKAGTSEKGNCSVCGKPWVRVVEKDKSWSRREQRIEETYYSHRKQFDKTQGGGGTSFVGHKGYFKANGEPIVKPTKTIGWQPSCTCNADTVKPIVLDPFMGSGTVAEVCERYGRAWIGIELSQEYCDIARKRINKEAAQMKLEIS